MATALVSPFFIWFDPDTGSPLAGGLLHSFESGSSSVRKPTYHDASGSVPNTNPVVLNSAGYAAVYLNGSYRLVLEDADGNVVWDADPVSSQSGTVDEWQGSIAATYVSPTSFSVAGNQTATFTVGRAIQVADATTFTSHVQSSAYAGGVTTISIYGTETLTASLSSVKAGLLSAAPIAIYDAQAAVAGGKASATRGSALYVSDGPTGGSSDYLDGIDGLTGGPKVNGVDTPLQTGDTGVVMADGYVAIYRMNATSGETPDGNLIVAPVSNSGQKRWVKQKSYFDQSALLQQVYPVGIIISTYTDTNPATTFGFGTWALHGAGRVPVCVDSTDTDLNEAGKTGGAKTVTLTGAQSGVAVHNHGNTGTPSVDHTHTGTTSSNGAHTHAINAGNNMNNSGTDTGYYNYSASAGGSKATEESGAHTHTITTGGSSASHTHAVNDCSAAAASESHGNLQPYITEYRWRRTA
ncbi:MAG: hypothetical protein HGA87_00195 [Desulfobulbaceae bacterium]|nr:hypothetical protein [Desulfobulbaceae bacterium]